MAPRRPYLATLTLELRLAEAASLKDKRMVLRSLKDGVRRHFGVTVAEVDGMDDVRRAVVVVAGLATGRREADALLASLGNYVERKFGAYDLTVSDDVLELP